MSFSKKTILIVDANKTLILFMGIMLRRMGFNVVPADSGLEALKLMKMVTPDLVILDSGLPTGEGLETISHMRSGAHTSKVPVVMMMADEDEAYVAKCGKAGCNAFLPKPIPMDLLHEHIQDFIFSPLGFRRKHLRVHADIKVFVTQDESFREYRTETVSEGGAYLRTDTPLKVGTKIGVVIPHKEGDLRLNGAVIYIKSTKDDKSAMPLGMAIEFRDISPQHSMTLNRLISELIAGDISDITGGNVIHAPWRSRPGDDSISAGEA